MKLQLRYANQNYSPILAISCSITPRLTNLRSISILLWVIRRCRHQLLELLHDSLSTMISIANFFLSRSFQFFSRWFEWFEFGEKLIMHFLLFFRFGNHQNMLMFIPNLHFFLLFCDCRGTVTADSEWKKAATTKNTMKEFALFVFLHS